MYYAFMIVNIIQYHYLSVNRESTEYFIILLLTKIIKYDTLVLYLVST